MEDPTAEQRLRAIEIRKKLDDLDKAEADAKKKAEKSKTSDRSADLGELFDARAGASRRVVRMSLSQDSAFGNLGGLSGLQDSWFAKSRKELDSKRAALRAAAAGGSVSERDAGAAEVTIGGSVADDIAEIRRNLGGVST